MKKPKNMHQMPKKRDYSQKVYNLLLKKSRLGFVICGIRAYGDGYSCAKY
jgi:hypothetical protein